MKRQKGWLPMAARAHEILTHHHRRVADEARQDAAAAEQRSQAALQAETSVKADWAARRRHAAMDPALDQAYVAYHRQLAQQATQLDEEHHAAEITLDRATAELRATHGTHQMLDELITRREREHTVAAGKHELQATSETWLLAKQHQLKKDGSE